MKYCISKLFFCFPITVGSHSAYILPLLIAGLILSACNVPIAQESDPTSLHSPLESNQSLNEESQSEVHVLWQSDHETGDFYDWSHGSGWWYWDEQTHQPVNEGMGAQVFGEVLFNSNTPPGDCIATISDELSLSGKYALKLDLTGAAKATQGCRVFRTWLDIQGDTGILFPAEAYYSAWYYLPQEVQTVDWWNIFQFKSSSELAGNEAMLSFNIDSDGKGNRSLYVYHKKGDNSCDCAGSCQDESYEGTLNTVNLPLQEWFQIEAFVRQSTIDGDQVSADGALQVWVNDTPIIDQEDICTLLRTDARLQWSVNNYTDEIIPSDVTLFIDDAAISTQRLGTSGIR